MKKVALICLVLFAASVGRAGTISNYSAWDQDYGVGLFTGTSHNSFSSYATFGETFRASVDNSMLTSITFYISNDSGSPINFFAEVGAWNNRDLTGPALFTSPAQTLPTTSAYGYQVVSVPVSSLVLSPGSEYIVFFSTIGLANTSTAEAYFGCVNSDAVPNSNIETNDGTTQDGLYVQNNWSSGGPPELTFTLQFGAVPEPSTWAMLGLGTVGVGAMALRRRRAWRED